MIVEIVYDKCFNTIISWRGYYVVIVWLRISKVKVHFYVAKETIVFFIFLILKSERIRKND